MRVADGAPDLEEVGDYPTNLQEYLADLRRALGNYVILDHGDGVGRSWHTCNAARCASRNSKRSPPAPSSEPSGTQGSARARICTSISWTAQMC